MNPYISRIIWQRRALGIVWTFRLTWKASTWRKLCWPMPVNLRREDSE
jgi:hypothetical protein